MAGARRGPKISTGSEDHHPVACDVAKALGYAMFDAERRAVLNHVIGALVLLTR
jgi:hypothetical protein